MIIKLKKGKYYIPISLDTFLETFAIGQTHLGNFSFIRVRLCHILCMFLLKSFHFMILHSLGDLILTLNIFSHSVIKLLLFIV